VKDLEDMKKELVAPLEPKEIEWRVQQAGISNGKVWCMVLAYIDARALQKRLDDVFGFDGWEDSYQQLGDDFICTLTVDTGKKKVSKQNGASKTQVDGFKGGISNSFKRVCASGYGIGRYLYDLDTTFAETTMNDPKDDKRWVRQSLKDKQTGRFEKYWFKKPELPDFAKPKISSEQILELESKIIKKGSDKNALMAHLEVYRLKDITPNQYEYVIEMLNNKKDIK